MHPVGGIPVGGVFCLYLGWFGAQSHERLFAFALLNPNGFVTQEVTSISSKTIEITADQLRGMVANSIASTIDFHRASRAGNDSDYELPSGLPTDDEIDDFIWHNPLLDMDTIEHLVDPALLGPSSKNARADEEWILTFKENLDSWASNNSWLAADEPWFAAIPQPQPDESSIWVPGTAPKPGWIATTPSVLLIAANLLRGGNLLTELTWREFEELVGTLLEQDGWHAEVTQPTRDGGVDVIATKRDETLGDIRTLWQAKKYGPSNKVKLREVRELSAVLDRHQATKGVIVTTSRMTRGAIEWIRHDTFRLAYKEHEDMARWIQAALGDVKILGK